MPKTNLSVLFGRNALNMRGDFTVTVNAGGEQPLALASDLVNENSHKKYATYEPDYWLLDGTYKFMPESVSVGYMSTEQSDEETGGTGSFSTAPQLQFDFTGYFDTTGLTLYFGEATGDYADDITIAFYDAAATGGPSLIRTDNYNPTGTTFATGQAVADFDRIVITFNGTNNPFRFARLISIDFDTLTRWSGSNIKSGKLIEEVDPLSLRMTSNEIEFTLFSDDGDFSITDPANEYLDLQENEPIEAYEQVGDVDIFLGRFYLDEWESLSENEAHFTALDAISLMEGLKFLCPKTSVTFSEDLIAAVMTATGVDHSLDASLEGVWMWDTYAGTLPVMSCRDALQQMLLITGGYASCARSRSVNIYPLELASDLVSYDFTLTAAEKGITSPVNLRKAVTSVEVFSNSFARIYWDTAQDVFDGSLAIGEHTLVFDDYYPIFNTTITGTASLTITDEGRNWVILDVTVAGTVVITQSYRLVRRSNKYVIENAILPATTPINVISVKDGYLVHPDDGIIEDTTQRIYGYYLQRYVQKTKLFGSTIKAGDSVLIDTQSSKQIKGIVERAEYNLTGGFVSDIEIIGVIEDAPTQSIKYNNTSSEFTYTGFPNTDSNVLHYDGDIRWSPDAESGHVDFTFTGFQFIFIYRQLTGGLEGSVKIYIDGTLIDTIDQNGTTVYQQEWTSPAMSNTHHVVKFEKDGTNGTANIDAVEIFYK